MSFRVAGPLWAGASFYSVNLDFYPCKLYFTSDMSEPRHVIHIRIRDLRRERALTQEELAEALGLSRQSINAMEAGRCLPSLPVALQIASYFSVPLGTIFGVDERSAMTSALIPWTPLRDLRESLAGLEDERLRWLPAPTPILPTANLRQDEHSIQIELCLPGYRKEDLAIEVGEDFVTVAGQPSFTEIDSYMRQEFMLQEFQRTISLPSSVYSDRAEAKMEDGILRITVPRREERSRSSRITIS